MFSRVLCIFISTGFGLTYCNELFNANIVKDISNHYHTKWIIIQSCKKTGYPILKLSKDIMTFQRLYISVFSWEDFLMTAEMKTEVRPLVLLTCWSCPVDCLYGIADLYKYSRFMWLMFGNLTEVMSMEGLHIPLNCFFILAEKSTLEGYILMEIYKHSPDSEWLTNTIGYWNIKEGVNLTSVSFEERRSNFLGRKIPTMMERADNLNPFLSIYHHYVPCYWDIARRLNFTIENKTKPNDSFEISILTKFTDVETNEVHLQPLFTTWECLFYKDEGRVWQFNSYLKPIKTSVWLAIIPIIAFPGFLSYISSRILRQLTNNTTPAPRFDTYIFQSLYIMMQKYESAESFIAQRIITLSQWIISICLINWYSAIFISFVSVSIPSPPFTTVDGILERGSHNIVVGDTIVEGFNAFFQQTTDVKLKKLYHNHFDKNKNVKENPVQAFCGSDRYLLLTSELHVKKIKRDPQYQNCTISETHIRLSIRHLSWTIVRGSQYERFIRFYLSKLSLAGALNDHFVKRETYRALPEASTFRKFSLEDVYILFITLTGGVMLSVFILCLENIIHFIVQ